MDAAESAVDSVDLSVKKEQVKPTTSVRCTKTKLPAVVVAANPQRPVTSTKEARAKEEESSTKEFSVAGETEASTEKTSTDTEKTAKEKNSGDVKTTYRSLESRLSLEPYDRHSERDPTTETCFAGDTTGGGDLTSAYNYYYANYANYISYAMSPQGRLAASNAALQTALENYWAQMQIASAYLMPGSSYLFSGLPAVSYSNPYYQPTNTERVSISLESSLRPSKVDLRLSVAEDVELGDATTIMLRNIPNCYTREMLLGEFRSKGVLNSIDFFYLPIDLRHRRNVGYCFLNFLTPTAVAEFMSKFDHVKLEKVKSGKTCRVARAKVQGRDANVEQYRNSAVMGMDDSCHPIVLKDGEREPFPSPTKSKEEMRAHQPEIKGVSCRNVSSVQDKAGGQKEQKNSRNGKKIKKQSQQQKQSTENAQSSPSPEDNDVAPKKKNKRNSKNKLTDNAAQEAQEKARPQSKASRRYRASRNSNGNGQEAPAKVSE